MDNNADADNYLNDNEIEQKLKESNDKIVRMFRELFSSPNGQIVLNQLLTDLRYFDECKTEDDTALSNYAKFLIKERLGVNVNKKLPPVYYKQADYRRYLWKARKLITRHKQAERRIITAQITQLKILWAE